MTYTIVFSIIALLIGFFGARFLYMKKSYEDGKVDGAYEKEKEIFYNTKENENSSAVENLKNQLENAYRKGVIDGESNEKKKISIKIIPKIEIADNFFSKTLYTGYEEQLTYDGIPIGEPKYVNTRIIKKFKDDNFKYVIDKLDDTVNNIATSYLDRGIVVNRIEAPLSPTKRIKSH